MSDDVKKLLVAGKIPLIKFKRNYLAGWWGIPGGKFDSREHLPEAAAREIKEELGLDASLDQFLGTVDEFAIQENGDTSRPILFVVTMRAKEAPNTAERDLPEGTIRWFTREEIASLESEVVPSDFRIMQDIYFNENHGHYSSKLTRRGKRITLEYFDRIG